MKNKTILYLNCDSNWFNITFLFKGVGDFGGRIFTVLQNILPQISIPHS